MPLSVVQIEGRAGFGVTVKLGEGSELGYHAFTVVPKTQRHGDGGGHVDSQERC
jgi:hypothetical protein